MGGGLPKLIKNRQRLILGGLLLLGLLNGLIFIIIMPPWQHYDEPGHFEYAWLIANHTGLPEEGEYDQAMRRELASSMVEHNFFAELEFKPNLLASTEPIYIGIAQTGDVPVYYWLISFPLYLFRTTDMVFQLYIARLVSLSLYLITILAAYGVVSEITPKNSVLRWLVPLTMICLPGFTDLMTAVNNDVGAVAFFSLFLWAAVRMVRRGFTWLRAAVCLLLAVLCVGTKATAFYAVLLLPLVVLASIRFRSHQKLIWIAFCCLCLVASGLVFSLNGATGWYLQRIGEDYRREKNAQSIDGKSVMMLQGSSEGSTQLYYPLDSRSVELLRGQNASLGAWLWAEEPSRGRVLFLEDDSSKQSEEVAIGITPNFYCLPVTVREDTSFVNVRLHSPGSKTAANGPLYVDGVVLVEGDYCEDGTPQFIGHNGATVKWDEENLENLVGNGSFEQRALMARASILHPILGVWFTQASQTVSSLGDWSSSSWYYQETLKNLVSTFWGKFGWGHVPLLNNTLYWPLVVITSLGCLGAVFAVWKRRSHFDWRTGGLLLFVLVLGWAIAFSRGIGSLSGYVFISSARYAFPVIIVTMVVLVSGWNELLGKAGQYSQWLSKRKYWIYGFGLLCLNLGAWWSIADYYNRLP